MPWASPKPVDTIDEKLKKVSGYISLLADVRLLSAVTLGMSVQLTFVDDSGGAVVDTPGPRYGNYLQEDPKIPKYKIIFSVSTY